MGHNGQIMWDSRAVSQAKQMPRSADPRKSHARSERKVQPHKPAQKRVHHQDPKSDSEVNPRVAEFDLDYYDRDLKRKTELDHANIVAELNRAKMELEEYEKKTKKK